MACGITPQTSNFAEQWAAQPTPISTQTYLVQPGDTPKGVALKYCTDVETLIALNAKTYPEMAQAPMKFNYGWKIRVPKTCYKGGEGVTVNNSSSPGDVVPVQQESAALPTAAPAVSAVDTNGGYFDDNGALEIIRLTNEARAAAGLSSLAVDERLMEIARKRAVEIVTDWGHQGLSDDCPECGENIVKGPGGPASDVNWWLNSESHRRNMMGGYVSMGAGRYIWQGRPYAVQIFHQ